MSESDHPSTQTRPYTVGVSIAVVLIFLIAVLHVWNFIFKKIKKRFYTADLEVEEIPVREISGRKISSACIQQLDMVLTYDDEICEKDFTNPRCLPTVTVERNIKISEKRSLRPMVSHKPRQSIKNVPINSGKVVFFAGYSHHHINDA